MEKIQIQIVGIQTLEASLASRHGAASTRVFRQHLAYDKELLAFAGDRRSDDFLRVAVHFRGIDQSDPELATKPQGRELVAARTCRLTHSPRAESECGHIAAVGEA